METFEATAVTLKNSCQVVLRPLQTEEAEIFHHAFIEIAQTSPYILSTPESVLKKTVEMRREWIRKQNENPRAVLMVAVDKERIIGITNMHPSESPKSRHRGAFGMSIHQDYRGLGLGTVLLKRLIELASEVEGLEILELNVMDANKSARKLYENFGFQEYGFHPKAYHQPDGTVTGDIAMYLELPNKKEV